MEGELDGDVPNRSEAPDEKSGMLELELLVVEDPLDPVPPFPRAKFSLDDADPAYPASVPLPDDELEPSFSSSSLARVAMLLLLRGLLLLLPLLGLLSSAMLPWRCFFRAMAVEDGLVLRVFFFFLLLPFLPEPLPGASLSVAGLLWWWCRLCAVVGSPEESEDVVSWGAADLACLLLEDFCGEEEDDLLVFLLLFLLFLELLCKVCLMV